MKKIYYPLACCLIGGMLASCGGGAKKQNVTEESTPTTVTLSYSKSLKGAETDSLTLPIDADGYITIFDGTSLDGADMAKTKYLPDGLLKMAVLNLTAQVLVKDRLVKEAI